MNQEEIRELLNNYREGKVPLEQAVEKIRKLPFEDMGFAMVDHSRQIRQGFPEVVYAISKTKEQVRQIMLSLYHEGTANIMATHASREMYDVVRCDIPEVKYDEMAHILYVERESSVRDEDHKILVLTAGTSDIPVAEEARLTAQLMGNEVHTCYDVGVAGIHRLFAHIDRIQEANVLIVLAGMEGALASVVGGLTAKPVIAVPTSVGYGTSFHGVTALLSMLNSCASGVAVMNIDNGFGAGVLASKINKMR